ncbi:MAG: peptide chain release factor N(5)-glutamine methyltransferase [Candidatus Pacebacteria bacterium]|nr:peptide chain release factor N(5)-glutamine methyltransferase [Candidatus Paceibacterota bacterium]
MKNSNLKQEIVWLLNEKYGGKLTDKAKKDITRLRAGEPIDYIIGHKNFCGCKIDLRYKPLIPRDETEYWVQGNCLPCTGVLGGAPAEPLKNAPENAKDTSIGKKIPTRFLDIFAGSGCCGIAVLKNVANSHCDFVDINDNCLKQIRFNLKLNGIDKKRYRIIKSNIFEKLKGRACPERAKRVEGYDVILANPPYIGLGEKSKVQESVLNFEPRIALFAKNNGLYFIEKFLKQARSYLAPEGVIYMEFGYNQKMDIEKLLKKFKYQNFEFHKDQFGKWRWVMVKKHVGVDKLK